jgi:acyl dehydratase
MRQAKFSLKARTLIMAILAAATCGAGLSVGVQGASADATTPPPWDTFNPTDGATYGSNSSPVAYGSVGGLLFYNAAGQQITGGSISTAPIAAYVAGATSAGGTKTQLYIAAPATGSPAAWSRVSDNGAATTNPITSGAPANLEALTTPVYAGAAGDNSISTYLTANGNDPSNPDPGYFQLRLYPSGSGAQSGVFNSADIYVDTTNDTWTLAYSNGAFDGGTSSVPTPVGTAVNLTTTAGTTGQAGTQVPLTATVTDDDSSSPAGGTVQFLKDGVDLGTPVTVTGDTATTSYITTTGDEPSDTFTADFTPVTGTNYSGSDSNSLVFDVTPPPVATNTVLTASSTSPQPTGTSVTFTATVTDTDSSTPTGTVTFKDGTNVLANDVALVDNSGNYQAQFSSSSLTVGTHSLSAVYNAPTGYTSSTGDLSFTVTSTTTTLTASPPSPDTHGTSVTFTAKVTDSDSSTPTGTITFEDGGTAITGESDVALTDNAGSYEATYTTSALTVATHSLSAVYNAPTGYPTSTGDLSYTVDTVGTSTTLTASPPSPDTYGTSVTFTAKVTDSDSSIPSGTITFEDGGTAITGESDVALTDNAGTYEATYTTSALTVATHSLSAVYNAPTNYVPSTGNLSYTVDTVGTSTTLTASPPSPDTHGTSVTFTAKVTDSDSSTPTGTITFEDGGTAITGESDVALTDNAGSYEATYTTSALTVATHSLSAVYNAPTNYVSSTGNLSYTVNGIGTSTSLTAAPTSPDTHGTSVTFTAKVTDSDSSIPTGTITFEDGGTAITGESDVALTDNAGSYEATYTTSALTVATHSLSAVYNAPTNYVSSTGNLSYTVNGIGTSTSLTAAPTSPDTFGTSVSLTATVTDADASSPTGTVTFFDGSTAIDSNVALTEVSGNYEAQYTTSTLSAATHALSAVYNPPAGYASSTGDLSYVVNPAPVVGPSGKGYWLFSSDGGVFNYGDAPFYGSAGSLHLNKPIVAGVAVPGGGGYWLFASDGGVFNYGDAGFYGSAGSLHLNAPIVAAAVTPDGKGYWLFSSDGGVFNYGDAGFDGSAGSVHLNKPIVAAAASPDGGGYWLFASDGGVFNYGDAGFDGSAGSVHLNKPIVAAAASPDGGGYWLFASDGGVFDYGDAGFDGSAGSLHLNSPIVAATASPDGGGYWLFASDGGVFNYGDAGFYGSAGSVHLNAPVVGAVDS